MKKDVGKVISQERLAEDIYDLRVETPLAAKARAGQFFMLYPKNAALLLPRPISVCELPEENVARFVYRTVGQGTREFSAYRAGDTLSLTGPLGNGFPIGREGMAAGESPVLFGGGIGIPPMLETAKAYVRKGIRPTIVVGYRDAAFFLYEELRACGDTYAAAETGLGEAPPCTSGNVLDAVREKNISGDVFLACGPMPMLRAIKAYAKERGIKTYLSLEERMACGVGACLGCVCKTTGTDAHSFVRNARVCTEGPVFDADDVEL